LYRVASPNGHPGAESGQDPARIELTTAGVDLNAARLELFLPVKDTGPSTKPVSASTSALTAAKSIAEILHQTTGAHFTELGINHEFLARPCAFSRHSPSFVGRDREANAANRTGTGGFIDRGSSVLVLSRRLARAGPSDPVLRNPVE
jgi:hypothetical protein